MQRQGQRDDLKSVLPLYRLRESVEGREVVVGVVEQYPRYENCMPRQPGSGRRSLPLLAAM